MFWELFLSFAKIGIMTFGGGLAMLPMFERELCDNKGWITKEELLDFYAISQCTPGVIAVNVATFVGRKEKGFLGALIATLGVIFPSIVIILSLAMFFGSFSGNEIVDHAFAGARVGVCALVLKSVIKLLKSSVESKLQGIIYLLCCLAAIVLKQSPVILVVSAAVLAIIFMKEDKKV